MRTASYYSGCGGLDQGVLSAGGDIVWANELDAHAAASYVANIGSHMHQGDVATVEKPAAGDIDLVVGGPPCQGFSITGKLNPFDPRALETFRFLSEVIRLRPRAFIMENVPNLAINERFAEARQVLQERAREAGYGVALWLLDAEDFGVPQARKRMFLVGVLDQDAPAPPQATSAHVSVRQALATLPPHGQPGNDTLCTAKVTMLKKPVLRPSPWAGLLLNGRGRVLDLERPALTLPATMGGNITPIIDQRWLEDPTATPWIVTEHERLRAGGASCAVPVPNYLRRLTVQEAMVLQSFPTHWKLSGKPTIQFTQVGNSVPPLLAEAVARQVLEVIR